MDSVTEVMDAKAGAAFLEMLGNVPVWNIIEVKPFLHHLVACVSSHVFLSPELSDNAEQLKIALHYVIQGVMAAQKFRGLHPILRPFARWWLHESRVCRSKLPRCGR